MTMVMVMKCAGAMALGVFHSLHGVTRIFALSKKFDHRNRNSKILRNTVRCALVNAVAYLLSIALPYAFGPLESFYSLSLQYGIVATVFLVRTILSVLYFQDVAKAAFKYSTNSRKEINLGPGKVLSDVFFNFLMEQVFLVLEYLVTRESIYFFAPVMAFVFKCLLCSYYCFTYKWFFEGQQVNVRFNNVEEHWPYHVGFGLPLALVTHLPKSQILSGCLFSMLFPIFIVSGTEAKPVDCKCGVALRVLSIWVPLLCQMVNPRQVILNLVMVVKYISLVTVYLCKKMCALKNL